MRIAEGEDKKWNIEFESELEYLFFSEIVRASREDRIAELPCPVGSTVWVVDKKRTMCKYGDYFDESRGWCCEDWVCDSKVVYGVTEKVNQTLSDLARYMDMGMVDSVCVGGMFVKRKDAERARDVLMERTKK